MREEYALSTKTTFRYKKQTEEDSSSINTGRVTRHTDSSSHNSSRIYTRRMILLDVWSVSSINWAGFYICQFALNFYTSHSGCGVVSDLNKNIGGSTDLAKKRYGSADLHTPIQPPPKIYLNHCFVEKSSSSSCGFCLRQFLIFVNIWVCF